MPVISGGGGGGLPLTGGTLTGPLVLAPTDPTLTPLQIDLPVGAAAGGNYAWRVTSHDIVGSDLSYADVFGSLVARTNTTLNGVIELVVASGGGDALVAGPAAGLATTLRAGQSYFVYDHSGNVVMAVADSDGVLQGRNGARVNPIASGALPTTSAFVSGTGKQILTTRDVFLVVPCTLNPTAGAAGTVAVAISPDNVTYSALATITEPAGIALDGTIIPAALQVPAGWYVKLTATNATIGTGTYY